MKCNVESDKRLANLYSIMQSIEGKLGGGEGIEGIYGSITLTGMQKIFNSMRHNCHLDKSSTLVDIGAGLGRPLLHSLVEPGIKRAFGIELDHVKVAKAEAFVRQAVDELARRGGCEADLPLPHITCSSVEKVGSLEPATHAYSFWEGVPHSGKAAFGRLFEASRTLKAVAVVQRAIRGEDPARMMGDLGFGPLLLIANFPVKMSGSGRSFQAYVFSKIVPGVMEIFKQPTPHRPAALPAAATTTGAEEEAAAATMAACDITADVCEPAACSPAPRAVAEAAAAAVDAVATITGVKRGRETADAGVQAGPSLVEVAVTAARKQRTIKEMCRARKSSSTAVASKAAAGGKVPASKAAAGSKGVVVVGRTAGSAAASPTVSEEANNADVVLRVATPSPTSTRTSSRLAARRLQAAH